MPRKIFVKVHWEFPTAGHLVFWKPCPWVKIPKKMLYASAKNSCTKILKPSFENRLEFMPTNIKCLGKVWTICLWITRELINRVTLSVSELEYFELSKLSKFHSMPIRALRDEINNSCERDSCTRYFVWEANTSVCISDMLNENTCA